MLEERLSIITGPLRVLIKYYYYYSNSCVVFFLPDTRFLPLPLSFQPGFLSWLSHLQHKPTSSSRLFYFGQASLTLHLPVQIFSYSHCWDLLEPQLDPSSFQVLPSLDSCSWPSGFPSSEPTSFLGPKASKCKIVVRVKESEAKWPVQRPAHDLELINMSTWVTECAKSYEVKNIQSALNKAILTVFPYKKFIYRWHNLVTLVNVLWSIYYISNGYYILYYISNGFFHDLISEF